MINQPLFLGTFSLYAIIISGCASAGLFLSWWLDEERNKLILDTGIGVLFISLIGARVGFVIQNLSYFLDHPGEMPQFWLGGLSWPGAVLGAGLSLVGIHLIWKEPLGEVADRYLPLLGMVSFGVWLSSWWTASGYGLVVDYWFGIPVQDIYGAVSKRWPIPIIGAILSAGWIAGVILYPLRRGHEPGLRSLAGLAGLLFINLVISFFKVDPVPVLWGLRLESWFSILIFLVLVVTIYLYRKQGENGTAKT